MVTDANGKVAVSDVTSTELAILDGVTATTAELNILDGVTATATELNLIDGVTATTAEINYVDGVTSNIQTQLDAKQATIGDGDLTIARTNGLQAALDFKTSINYRICHNYRYSRHLHPLEQWLLTLMDTAKLQYAVSDVTSTELAILDGVTATTAEINILDGVTATATELNLIDGWLTATTAEINYVDGVTSNIQTQLDAKQATIGDGDLTIARTNGLQAALDAKQASITGSATTIDTETLTSTRAMVTDANGKVAVSDVTSTELAILDGVTATTAELNILDGVTSTAAEINLVDGSSAGTIVNSKGVIYGSSGEVNATTLQIAGTSITSTAAELNILDGVTSTAAEINIVDGGTSATSTTVADADRVVLNDNGTMVQVAQILNLMFIQIPQ